MMTKRRKAGKNQEAKHVNRTAHQRAMTNPKTQAILSALRKGWDKMSPEQRGEQIIELIGLKCSGSRDRRMSWENPRRLSAEYIGSAKTTGTNERLDRKDGAHFGKKASYAKAKERSRGCRRKPSETPAKEGRSSVIKKRSR